MKNELSSMTTIPDFAELRKKAGLSQESVAWSVGMDQSHLSKIERKIVAPTQNMIDRLLKFYESNLNKNY